MNDETVIRNGHDSHMRREQGLFSSEPSVKGASVRSRTGILVFSRGRQLLHINSRALELIGHLNQAEIGPVHDIRSAPVRELRAQIQEMLGHRREANIWEIFELKRVIFETERKILVRGFGLAGRNSHDDSRIVIILEEVGHRQAHKVQPAPVFSSESRGSRCAEMGELGPSPCLDRMGGAKNSGKETPIMRKHILVVDDDASLLSLLKVRLKSTGHTVDTAETGWDGLSKLEHAKYDVVLLDYMMPGITGLTVLEHIQVRRPSVPVVMMTGQTSSQIVAQALAGGARACLVKPVDPMELEQAMRCCV